MQQHQTHSDAPELVFDVGPHEGQDTAYFLRRGSRVVAIDADVRMVEHLRRTFADETHEGRLVVVNAAVADRDDDVLPFHLSKNSWWNSASRDISDRADMADRTVEVQSVTLARLIEQHGVPQYCKIDIEGLDAMAVRSLGDRAPRFISVETECLPGEPDASDAADPLATLEALRDRGYTRFKLVDQRTLRVLDPDRPFYPGLAKGRVARAREQLRRATGDRVADALLREGRRHRARVQARLRYRFPYGATGPYGADLAGTWIGYDGAARMLLRHRREYFASAPRHSWDFWCDWHAAS
jgi:FkbM family methyltransferase